MATKGDVAQSSSPAFAFLLLALGLVRNWSCLGGGDSSGKRSVQRNCGGGPVVKELGVKLAFDFGILGVLVVRELHHRHVGSSNWQFKVRGEARRFLWHYKALNPGIFTVS